MDTWAGLFGRWFGWFLTFRLGSWSLYVFLDAGREDPQKVVFYFWRWGSGVMPIRLWIESPPSDSSCRTAFA